ncbi:hypothetical protein ACJRO7_007542 [Eucalyptus globulus]|uniref:Nuclear pore protein n=1 Tax=Eucalyptus globulus TaxID=34317 RepID=A0ABD3ILE8_EUCGL
MEARKNVINNDFAEKESNCINGQSPASYLVWDDLTVSVPAGSKRKLLNQLSEYAQMGRILTLKLFECVREKKIPKSKALSFLLFQSLSLSLEQINEEDDPKGKKSIAMVSAIQEAQKDNVRSFNDYMLKVLEDDWQKEKRDFLQSLSRISLIPKTNIVDSGHEGARLPQIASTVSSPQVSSGPSGMEIIALVYGGVVKDLNSARERGLPFKGAYESLGINTSGGKSVSMQKIWHLIQALMDEDSVIRWNVSKKMSLVIGARRHLEWGHEKYIMDMIQSHPAALGGGGVGNLQRIRAFLWIRLRDYGVLYFDVGDARRQPPVDTTWQQIYFCLRTGYYNEARDVACHPVLTEWINTGGMGSAETAATASEECEKLLRIRDQVGRAAYDKKRLLLYAMISDLSALFTTIEDFLWFKLSAIREFPLGGSSAILSESSVPYSSEDLQAYLNKFAASYYTKNGKDPLVYPYILLLSVQFLPAILYLSKEAGDEGYNIDATHIAIVLADHGVLKEGTGARSKFGVMDTYAEASSMIQQYGSSYLYLGDLSMALEYYAQAVAAVGGGRLSWTGRANANQQRQRSLMLKQLLMELLLRDGGICFLLGSRGSGEEGELTRFIPDIKTRQQFLLEAARQCLEAGIYDKVWSFSLELGRSQCLSDSICALSRGRLDGESQTAGLVHSGNEILETYKYSPEIRERERESVMEQQTVLRQLEAILSIYKLARAGHYLDALREVAKLPFLPLDPRTPDVTTDVLQNLSPYVRACVPDILKVSLSCMDNVPDSDGSLSALKAKIANFLANNLKRNWPRDLYEKVARSL